MGSCTNSVSDTFSASSIISLYNQSTYVPWDTFTSSHNSTRQLDYPSIVSRRPSNAPLSSPAFSPERHSKDVLPRHAENLSYWGHPLIYLEEQLVKVQPETQGSQLENFGPGTKPRFSFEEESYDHGACTYSRSPRCHCSYHDDESTIAGLSTQAPSISSETGTILEEDNNIHSITHKAALTYEFPELYPSNSERLDYTMPSPAQPSVCEARSPWVLQPQRSYEPHESPSVATRKRQISLPVMASAESTVTPDVPASASIRAQSWPASPVYSPSREPPIPPPGSQKSIFEDFDDEDNVEEKKLSKRFRHLMRRLHCG